MPYVSRSPSEREKKMFVVGIAFGAVLSFLGSYTSNASFRILDNGISEQNIIILIASLAIFIVILLKIPSIIKKI